MGPTLWTLAQNSEMVRSYFEGLRAGSVRKPDLVHVHDCEWILAGKGIAQAEGCPLVMTKHFAFSRGLFESDPVLAQVRDFSFDLQMEALRACNHCIYVVDALRQDREKIGVSASTWSVVHNAADPGQSPAPPTRANRLVAASRLAASKGIDVLIEALRYIDCGELLILGDGPERSKLEALAQSVAPGRVTFAGRVSAAHARAEIRASRLLVCPSLRDICPMVLVEARADGVPVIASDISSIREVFGGRPGCYLAQPAAALDLARSALSALKDDYRSPDPYFQSTRMCRETAEVYEKALRHFS